MIKIYIYYLIINLKMAVNISHISVGYATFLIVNQLVFCQLFPLVKTCIIHVILSFRCIFLCLIQLETLFFIILIRICTKKYE